LISARPGSLGERRGMVELRKSDAGISLTYFPTRFTDKLNASDVVVSTGFLKFSKPKCFETLYTIKGHF